MRRVTHPVLLTHTLSLSLFITLLLECMSPQSYGMTSTRVFVTRLRRHVSSCSGGRRSISSIGHSVMHTRLVLEGMPATQPHSHFATKICLRHGDRWNHRWMMGSVGRLVCPTCLQESLRVSLTSAALCLPCSKWRCTRTSISLNLWHSARRCLVCVWIGLRHNMRAVCFFFWCSVVRLWQLTLLSCVLLGWHCCHSRNATGWC